MAIWVAQRLGLALLTAFCAFVIVFSLLRIIPGDPVELMLGEQALAAQKEVLRQNLGLDLSWPQQLGRDLQRVARVDLGNSIQSGRAVTELIGRRLGPTVALAVSALLVALFISVPLGIVAGWKPGSRIDSVSRVIAVLGVSVPNFWLGPLLLLVFAVWLRWFPLGGYRNYWSLVLPAITLGTALAAMLTRMLRAGLVDTRQALFVQTARAKGLAEQKILFWHALRPGLIPVVTVVGLQLGALLSGAVITETIFQWPGIGRLLIEAVQARDYPVVQGVVIVLTLIYVLVNTLVDVVYVWVDPRIRTRES